MRKHLGRIGKERLQSNKERFQIIQESLGGIKEVKAAGLEAGYIKSFGKSAQQFAKCQAANRIIGQYFKFALQSIAFGGILVVILVMMTTRDGVLEEILPTLGVFAFAGQRLLPALQQIYQNVAQIRFSKPALEALHADLSDEKKEPLKSSRGDTPLTFKQHIELSNISFTYPGGDQPAIHGLNLKIPANTTVGFVGSSGAGKTTLVDIIMALLTPDHGQLLIDEQPIFEEQNTPTPTLDNSEHNAHNSQNNGNAPWDMSPKKFSWPMTRSVPTSLLGCLQKKLIRLQ